MRMAVVIHVLVCIRVASVLMDMNGLTVCVLFLLLLGKSYIMIYPFLQKKKMEKFLSALLVMLTDQKHWRSA